MFTGAHGDSRTDARQEACYSRLYDAIPLYNPSIDYHLLLDANNAPDWTLDRRGNPAPNRIASAGWPRSDVYSTYFLAASF